MPTTSPRWSASFAQWPARPCRYDPEVYFQDRRRGQVGESGTCAFFPRNVPHAWKNTDSETGRVLFLYASAADGGYLEALLEGRAINSDEANKLRQRYRWEVVGRNPL